jgi:xanthine dehydrogenase accessory factor
MIAPALSRRADELRAARAAFVVATVVRAQRPTSVHAGDTALVLADGTIEGFVGGACAEQSVRLHALRALETGEGLLLRVLPGDDDAPAAEGAVTVQNPCLSGGSLEIFLEPMLVAPRVLVIGETPIAHALVRLGEELDLDMVAAAGDEVEPIESDLALVVAAHGRDELRALRTALEARVPYVGLVASRVRGAAVVEELRAGGADLERLATLETPAGLDIGARTPSEIALSILARIVTVRRGSQQLTVKVVAPAVEERPTAIDPVCGMAVAAVDATPHVEHEGRRVYFCCEGCLSTWTRSHALE